MLVENGKMCKQQCVAKTLADGKRVGVTSSRENVRCYVSRDHRRTPLREIVAVPNDDAGDCDHENQNDRGPQPAGVCRP
jgi:hypothetical protein